MATDRPDDSDADTDWIFEPQSEDEAGLNYLGRSARRESSPRSQSPATPASAPPSSAAQSPSPVTPAIPVAPDASVPADASAQPAGAVPAATPDSPTTPPAPSGPTGPDTPGRTASTRAAAPAPPSASSNYNDLGPATAPFTPRWASGPPSSPSDRPAAAAAPGAAARTGHGPGGQPNPTGTGRPGSRTGPGPGGPGSANPPGGRPPSGGGAGQAIAVGAMVGTIVLLLAWFFLLRDAGTDATRAVPVRTSAASLSPSATPSPTRSAPRSTRTTAPASPKATRSSASPSVLPTPSPTNTLNDASNRLGWTYIIDGLGPVKLGMSATKATALGVLQNVASGCSDYAPTDLLGSTLVYATGGEVTAIDIRSAAFASGRGIRVGTPLDNLKTMYGDALKSTTMTDGGTQIQQWALTSNSQFVAYVIGSDGAVSRIVIGYRGSDGSITLPPPC